MTWLSWIAFHFSNNLSNVQYQLGEVQISLQQKQTNQMTHALWRGNNGHCVLLGTFALASLRILSTSPSSYMQVPMLVLWSICILQLCVLTTKKKRKETAIAGIMSVFQNRCCSPQLFLKSKQYVGTYCHHLVSHG